MVWGPVLEEHAPASEDVVAKTRAKGLEDPEG
jgi:hypothetical protein